MTYFVSKVAHSGFEVTCWDWCFQVGVRWFGTADARGFKDGDKTDVGKRCNDLTWYFMDQE